RLKRRRSIENKTHFTRSAKRSLTSSTSSSAPKTKSPLHATTYKQPSNSTANNDSNFTNPSPQQQPDSVPPSSQQQPDSATDTDSEIEIYLDEDSSSDSEPDMENDHRAFRNNMSHTITGNSALQGYDDLGDALCECEECGAYMWYQERKGKSKHTTMP
ncbi:helicase-like protein, partial [Trifolium medium]|nr:helicase-like protein [Trifolium medium]